MLGCYVKEKKEEFNMAKVIKIGMDTEFMAYDGAGSKPIYPLIDKDRVLVGHGCDEFGHCVEVRPKEADNAEDLLTNIMKEMARLPGKLTYKPENMHTMDKKTFISLIRARGTAKEIPGCKNIYKTDVLDDCEADIKARKEGKRVVFCGMHVHISAMDARSHPITIGGKTEHRNIETSIELPVQSLVYLFDHHIFSALAGDKDANIGRYRAKGFYEMKAANGSHFEYRSLGSTVFTPKRVGIIFEIIKEIMMNTDFYMIQAIRNTGVTSTKMSSLYESLKKTKPSTQDLRKLWVPWE